MATPPPTPRAAARSDRAVADLDAIAAHFHQAVVDRLDLAAVCQLEPDQLRPRLRQLVEQLVTCERIALSAAELAALVEQTLDELTGLGPLEVLLADPAVSDVLVNGPDQVFVEKAGRLLLTDVRFRDDRHLLHTIQRLVARVGRRVDESSPMVDARLPDGSRINAVVPPLALDGPCLSIRRFGGGPLTGDELVAAGSLSADMLNYLRVAVRARCSILVSGGTGAGKTTLLGVLSSFVSKRERIITVEDAAELRLDQPHVVRLETRPPNLEGKGAVGIRDLVRNALRMRPDRIIVGEVRGAEVLDMLQAMNTGHDGSMATVHANSPDDAISRLMTMLGMAGTPLGEETMASLIARAIHVVVQVARHADGRRRIVGIAEVLGQRGTDVPLHPVFAFERTGVDGSGLVQGRHTQLASSMLTDHFRAAGVLTPPLRFVQGGGVDGGVAAAAGEIG